MNIIEAYGRLAIVFVAILSIIYVPIAIKLNKKGKGIARQLSYLGLISSSFLIAFATILFVLITTIFTPFTFNLGQVLNFVPFEWLRSGDAITRLAGDVIPNVLMFIPLGFFIPVVFEKMRKIHKTTLVIFLTTFSIEVCQYFIGRSSDIDDIITNLLGGIIGYAVFKISMLVFENQKWWNKFIGNEKKFD